MLFARQLPNPQRVPDLSRFVDTPRQKKDPCFNCSLPFCNDRSKECAFIQTSFQIANSEQFSRTIERERQDLIDELKAEGVILGIRGNGFIEYANGETDEERIRRQKRDHMRKVRRERRAVGK